MLTGGGFDSRDFSRREEEETKKRSGSIGKSRRIRLISLALSIRSTRISSIRSAR